MWPLAAVLALPLIEIMLFVTIGGAIGLLATMIEIFGTAAFGVYLMRRQGVAMQEALRLPRRDPLQPLAEGAVVALASALLILPGFLTDAIGLLLLVPPVRRALIARLGRNVQVHSVSWPPANTAAGGTIDGDYVVVDPEPAEPLPLSGKSGWTRH